MDQLENKTHLWIHQIKVHTIIGMFHVRRGRGRRRESESLDSLSLSQQGLRNETKKGGKQVLHLRFKVPSMANKRAYGTNEIDRLSWKRVCPLFSASRNTFRNNRRRWAHEPRTSTRLTHIPNPIHRQTSTAAVTHANPEVPVPVRMYIHVLRRY
ncbi:hypothetical protein BS17DRAFT_312425 [Gyrodon lividus]|nr:hypothetical protein BS17DRAFT_312425 [Gyrodon lividus]